jgi:hypothetical protein
MSYQKSYCSALIVAAGLIVAGPTLSDNGTAAAYPGPSGTAQKERHPHIRKAIHELREARRELVTAAHDFGGHRVEAVAAVDAAIKQLELALKYDKR